MLKIVLIEARIDMFWQKACVLSFCEKISFICNHIEGS
jgi:hypothetical protein